MRYFVELGMVIFDMLIEIKDVFEVVPNVIATNAVAYIMIKQREGVKFGGNPKVLTIFPGFIH